ncbi:hypothetical protein HK101_010876, partial [Irineochytrium annulatum]
NGIEKELVDFATKIAQEATDDLGFIHREVEKATSSLSKLIGNLEIQQFAGQFDSECV